MYAVYSNGILAQYPDQPDIADYWKPARYARFEDARRYARLYIGTLIYKLPESWEGAEFCYLPHDYFEFVNEYLETGAMGFTIEIRKI